MPFLGPLLGHFILFLKILKVNSVEPYVFKITFYVDINNLFFILRNGKTKFFDLKKIEKCDFFKNPKNERFFDIFGNLSKIIF